MKTYEILRIVTEACQEFNDRQLDMETPGCSYNSLVKCPSSPSLNGKGKRVMTPNRNQTRSLVSVEKSTCHRQYKSSIREYTMELKNEQENENSAPSIHNTEKITGKLKPPLLQAAENRHVLLTKAGREKELMEPTSCNLIQSTTPENVSAKLVDSMSKLSIYSQIMAKLGEASDEKEDVPVVSKKRKCKESTEKERGKRKRVTFSEEVRTMKFHETADCIIESRDGCGGASEEQDPGNESPGNNIPGNNNGLMEQQSADDKKTRSARTLTMEVHICRSSASPEQRIDGHDRRPC